MSNFFLKVKYGFLIIYQSREKIARFERKKDFCSIFLEYIGIL